MSKLAALITATIVSVPLLVSTASAHGGGHGGGFHGRFHGGFHDHDGFHHGFRGGLFFDGGLYDPFFDGYAYPYAAPFYFCPPYNAYYPSVGSCPVPWQVVPGP
jgi:hypothetical protein